MLKISKISSLQIIQILRFGILLLIGIAFAKSSFSTEYIGYYETFLFVSTAVTFFWLSGLTQALLPIYKKSNTFLYKVTEKTPVLFNSFLLIVFFSIISGIILLLFKAYILDKLINSAFIEYYNLLIVYVVISSPAYIIEYIYLLKNKPKLILEYGLISYILQLLIVCLPVIFNFNLIWVFYGLIFISIIRFFWLIVLVFQNSKLTLSFKFIFEHLHLAWPLIVSSFLGGSAQYVDGFIITSKFDEATFAIFRFGARELPISVLLANAFSNAMLPEFSEDFKLDELINKIKKKSLVLMHLLFPLTIVMLLLSNTLFPIIFNSNFTESALIFNIYLLLIISRLLFPQTILIGLQQTKIILFTSVIEIIINVLLSLLLVNYIGISGVAIATVIAFLIEKLILSSFLYQKYDVTIYKFVNIKWYVFYSVITLLIYCFVEFYLF
ncbi:MAG: hypothetical protein A2046_04365 [Bacteroidetes bacterium GWA2_30_7]|nr:MAG: hypothetical protein A2046_04365 [Bacteroidetes bacterium GWA2_30_7]